jgi:hypothetical protein
MAAPTEVISAAKLRALTEDARACDVPLAELATDWLVWFENSAKRHLKTAALFGYTEATLDLPVQLSRSLDKTIHIKIRRAVQAMVPGCAVAFVEEEYEGAVVFRLEVSWAGSVPTLHISNLP